LIERDTAAAAPALLASSLDGGTKSGRGSESGRGGRKKYLSSNYTCSSFPYLSL